MRAAVLALQLLVSCAAAVAHQPATRSSAELMDILMWNREPVGGPFSLLDHRGVRRTDREFRGKLLLVYFGYTRCTDVCPTDLQQIALALRLLGPAASAVQPLFITLDPERDTQAHLATYVQAFDPRLIALRGTAEEVRHVAGEYRMYSRKVPVEGGDYVIDHAAATYVMGRDGRYIGFFPPGTAAGRMVEVLRRHLAAKGSG